ncbi:putative phosphatidate phosphatase [Nilaparvata lugens]|uniref:putative phosphatidate phosphatase n=1 Tax=Nilaparvata lugens TaxID=108931 RepID=UPI00193D21C1|nr:putative phosphatidate phosphatase [Nilaparvata lugens]
MIWKVHALKQVIMDCLINLSVYGLLRFISATWKTPWKGFFCSDISIMYPYTPALMDSELYYAIVFTIPIILVLLNSLIMVCRTKEYMGVLQDVYKILSMYLLGYNASRVTAMIGKRAIGRLRPNFYSACKPSVNCDHMSPFTYIHNFTCAHETDFTRNSFPSQHSTVAFYTAVFILLYLQKRPLHGSVVSLSIKHLIQIVVMQLAWTVAIFRIRNYFHHESDVLAGIMIGTFWAIVTVYLFLKLDIAQDDDIHFEEKTNFSLQLKEVKNRDNNGVTCKDQTTLNVS